jgi:hypothetical protein
MTTTSTEPTTTERLLDAVTDVSNMTTPALVREYGRSRFTAGYYCAGQMPTSGAHHARLRELVAELRHRGVLD